jgi:hypothetical protein
MFEMNQLFLTEEHLNTRRERAANKGKLMVMVNSK